MKTDRKKRRWLRTYYSLPHGVGEGYSGNVPYVATDAEERIARLLALGANVVHVHVRERDHAA